MDFLLSESRERGEPSELLRVSFNNDSRLDVGSVDLMSNSVL